MPAHKDRQAPGNRWLNYDCLSLGFGMRLVLNQFFFDDRARQRVFLDN